MVHLPAYVAQSNFLDETAFVVFCETQGEKHGVFKDACGTMLISTMHCDKVIAAAKAAGVRRLTHEEIIAKHRQGAN